MGEKPFGGYCGGYSCGNSLQLYNKKRFIFKDMLTVLENRGESFGD
jgi:hypothetical protein